MTHSALGRHNRRAGSALGLPRVVEPAGVLPQAAWRLDPDPRIGPDEVRVRVDRLNLDAASYRQLRESSGGEAGAMRAAVLQIVAERGLSHGCILPGPVRLAQASWNSPPPARRRRDPYSNFSCHWLF